MIEKTVQFSAAYDKRDPDPNKNYGIHGVTIRFVYKGEKGATQFVLYTNWHLPHVTEELRNKERFLLEPLPADLGYHSPTPQYEGQTQMDCDLLEGGLCYYDGSSLQADRVYKRLLEDGEDGVWAELEEEYKYRFETQHEGE